MGYHLEKDEQLGVGFRRMLIEQTARLSEALASADEDLEEAIHEVRKRCKRVRAVARLLRPHANELYRRENAAFRDIARRMSPFRDAHVQVETFDELIGRAPDRERFAALKGLLPADVNQDERKLGKQLAATRDEVRAAQKRLEGLRISDGPPSELIGRGLRATYKRGRRSMAEAYDKPEAIAFHEWRKHVKDLGYQMQILRNLWPAIFKRLRSELDTLGDLLGKEHDLTVMRSAILKNVHSGIIQEDLRAFLALAEEREFQLQSEAETIGRRIYAEKPKCFIKRIFVYWNTWQAEVPAPKNADIETMIPH
ncbi:MAG TPA: CHAD domain-containing protein [Terrimicrobiaceae bacterium]